MVGFIAKMFSKSSIEHLPSLVNESRKAGHDYRVVDAHSGMRRTLGEWDETTPVDLLQFVNLYELEAQIELDQVFQNVITAMRKAALSLGWNKVKEEITRKDPALQAWVLQQQNGGKWPRGMTTITAVKQLLLHPRFRVIVGDDKYEGRSAEFDKSISDSTPFALVQHAFGPGIWPFLPAIFTLSQ
jgi:hypothetical protein